MNTPPSLNSYWQLFRWLMLPARYHYWLFIFFLAMSGVALVGAIFGLLNMQTDGVLLVGLWVTAFMLWFSVSILVLHGQLLVLASNRQLHLLPGLRSRALALHLLALTLIAVFITAWGCILKDNELSVAGFVFNWALCVLASIIFLLCLIWFSSVALIAIWLMSIIVAKFFWPLGLSPWLLLIVALLAWVGFGYWWLRWAPAKKFNNMFLMRNWQNFPKSAFNPPSLLPARLRQLGAIITPSTSSLFHNLLNGGAGSVPRRVMVGLGSNVVGLIAFGFLMQMKHSEPLGEFLRVLIPVALWAYISGAGLRFFIRLYANLGRAWLYFPGTRAALFGATEKYFIWLILLDLVMISLLAGIGCYWIYPDYLQLKWLVIYCMLAISVNWLVFHFGWWLYCYTKGSNSWLGVASLFILIVQIFISGLCWRLVVDGHLALEILLSGIVVSCLSIGFLLRSRALHASLGMTFSRRPD